MSVILVTGVPGVGKTAHVVDMIAHDEQFKGRPLFVTGIPDLAIDHTPCPPVAEWTEYRTSPDDENLQLAYFTFPENSLVVLDEAQRVYRPRAVGTKVPPEVAAFETHRHTGVDFILLTQHPGLIDSNIRKLIGRHIHIRGTPFGRYKYEWTELGDPESASSREIASKERYKLPARAFDLYKSAQLHTKIKTKLPWYFWLFIVALLGVIGLSVYAYNRINSKLSSGESVLSKSPGQQAVKPTDKPASQGPDELLQQFVPVVPGRPETATAYDTLRQVKAMPVVAGCIQTATRCTCQNQQGLDAGLDELQCKDWLRNPPFNPYVDVVIGGGKERAMPVNAGQGGAYENSRSKFMYPGGDLAPIPPA